MSWEKELLKGFTKPAQDAFVKRINEFKILKDKEKKEEIAKACYLHDKGEKEKEPKDRWHYTDEYGYDVLIIKTHDAPRISSETGKAWNVPKIPKYPKFDDEMELTCEYPLFKGLSEFPTDIKLKAPKGFFYVKNKDGTYKKDNEGNEVLKDFYGFLIIGRGELTVQYKYMTEGSKWLFRKEFLESLDKKSIHDVDFDEYQRSFSFRMHQFLKMWKVR